MKDALLSIQDCGSQPKIENRKNQNNQKILPIFLKKLFLSRMKTAFFVVKYSSKKQQNLSMLFRLTELENQRKSQTFRKIYHNFL